MKWSILVLFLSAPAMAESGAQVVHEVATSTNTITQSINVCNSVLDVANATSSGTLAGYYAIEVANAASSTNTINCGFDLMLSSAIFNAWYGREVPAGSAVLWSVPSYRKLYCLSQNSGGCTRATVTQFK